MFHDEDAVIAEECILSPDKYDGTEIYQVLKKYGMIVPNETDEDVVCTHIAWKRIYNPSLILVIMPTEDCNFRCSYCYEEHKKGMMNIITAQSIIKFVAKSISSYTEVHVIWFGGEPLMSQQTIDNILFISEELIKICSCARKKYSADIITNGFNLTCSVFEMLLRCKIFSYQVTIDGLANIHDHYRFLANHEHTYDKIISNLLDIKENCKKKYFNIVIRTNITLEMENSLIEHYECLSKMFSDDSRFSFFFRPVGDWGGDDVKQLCDFMYDSLSFKKIYEKILNVQTELHLDFRRFILFYNNSFCSACYENSYIIGYDGKLYKCSCHFEEPDNKVGMLDSNGDMVLDREKIFKWVKKPEMKMACNRCFFAPVCMNMSCPIYSNNIKHTVKGVDDCPYEKKYIKETLQLLQKSGCFKAISLSKPNR